MLSEGWKEKSEKGGDAVVDEEDEEIDSDAEKYEAEYNFRFDDGTGAFIQSHRRKYEESLRLIKNARREKRKGREGRKKEEKVRFIRAILCVDKKTGRIQ